MNPYMAYEAINTKISSKRGMLMDAKLLEGMLNCNTTEQIASYLFEKYDFGREIANKDRSELFRDDLEIMLSRYKTSEVENLLHYFSGPYKEFIQTILMQYDVEDLCLIIRKLVNKGRMDNLNERFVHSKQYATLDFDKLNSSNSLSNLIDNLRGTKYYYSLRNITNEDFSIRQFHIEMKLYVLYYRTLFKRADALYESDKIAAKNILGTRVDLENIQWIYRAKNFYNIHPEEILIYCLPNGKRLKYNILKELSYLNSLTELKKRVSEYMKDDILGGDNEFDIAKNIEDYMYRYIKKAKFNNTIGVFLEYVFILNTLTLEFTTITEAIRYKLPKEKIKRYLICDI